MDYSPERHTVKEQCVFHDGRPFRVHDNFVKIEFVVINTISQSTSVLLFEQNCFLIDDGRKVFLFSLGICANMSNTLECVLIFLTYIICYFYESHCLLFHC